MKHSVFLISLILFAFFSVLAGPKSYAQEASTCCPSWAPMNSSCITSNHTPGLCQTSGNIEPWLTQCSGANPPLLSCRPNCNNARCPAGANQGDSCTTTTGNPGTCQNAPHMEPYLSECPGTEYACLTEPVPIAGCCLPSQSGEICLINPTTTGNCRAPDPSVPFEMVCIPWYVCAAPTGSGSFTCNCTKTAYGFNCTIGPTNTCQMGLMPNANICNPNRTINPCGNDDSFSSCQLPCVPGGYLPWGSFGCVPYDPNAIPPVSQDLICEPGLVCQNGNFCMKPNGSVPFSEACIWDSECGTCLNGYGGTVQLTCAKYDPNSQIGICDGQCGGTGGLNSDGVQLFCNNEVGTVRTAIGCIKASDPRAFINQLVALAIRIAAGITLLSILYSGFVFTTAFGSKDRIVESKELLFNSLIYLLIIALAVVIINFLGVRVLGLNLFGFQV